MQNTDKSIDLSWSKSFKKQQIGQWSQMLLLPEVVIVNVHYQAVWLTSNRCQQK